LSERFGQPLEYFLQMGPTQLTHIAQLLDPDYRTPEEKQARIKRSLKMLAERGRKLWLT
jgi:hypothetical protein